METLMTLWLPIVLSAVAVFFLSFLTWAVLPFHHKEYQALPDEEHFIQSLTQRSVPPGNYMFPFAGCQGEKMKDPAYRESLKSATMGHVHVWKGMPNMGLNMALTLMTFLILSIIVAHLATWALPPGADGAKVFEFTTKAAFLGFALGGIPHGIWFNRSARAFALDFIDAVVFAVVTGAIFAWLWPSGPGAPVIPGING